MTIRRFFQRFPLAVYAYRACKKFAHSIFPPDSPGAPVPTPEVIRVEIERINESSPNLGTSGDSTDQERWLRNQLLSGRATPEEGLRLYQMMAVKGESFPVSWEEILLKLIIAKQPDRQDLLARLRFVLTAQGKAVPEKVERAFAEYVVKQERERDHQKDAAEYHNRTGTKDMDAGFLPIYERCREYSMTSVERMYALYSAINYITEAKIEGAIVECGVWRGGSMMVAAKTLLQKGCSDRELYLFDTYEGLPRPSEEKDIDIWGNRAIDGWLPNSVGDEKSHWAEAGLDEVRTNMLSTGYPSDRLHLVKGMVERTIPGSAPEQIALLRLDTDWYASTKHELEHLFSRISPHGVLIIDDYGHFKGARQAVDEFIAEKRIPIMLTRVDYSGRIAIKVT